MLVMLAWSATVLVSGTLAAGEVVPTWLYPMAGIPPAEPYNAKLVLRLSDSQEGYPQAQLFDQFAVTDWHPDSHGPMPDAVRDARRDDRMRYDAYAPLGSIARGKAIATTGLSGSIACDTCHGPALRGMAVFLPIAGRSPTYILRQLYAVKMGPRNSAGARPMLPVVVPLTVLDMIAAAYAASLDS